MLAPGERLRSHSDPTADEATNGAERQIPKCFQCVRCHCVGSELDESSWPLLAGTRVHVTMRVVPDVDLAVLGIDGWIPERSLCGAARVIRSRR